MKRSRIILCVLAFVLVCGLTVLCIRPFIQYDIDMSSYMWWDVCQIVDEDEKARSFDLYGGTPPWDWREGETFRLTGTLPSAEEVPELYENGGYLRFDYNGADVKLLIDGEEVCHASSPRLVYAYIRNEGYFVPSPEDAGKELTVLYRPLEPEAAEYVLSFYISSFQTDFSSSASMAAQSAIPAGAYALGFVLICALFLIGLALGSPDWSLILLALASAFTFFWQLASTNPFALPDWDWLTAILSTNWPIAFPYALILLYLTVNRKRHYWRYFVRVTLATAAVLALWNLCLYLTGHGPDAILRMALLGFFPAFLLCEYLVAVCACMAAWSLLRRVLAARNEAAALSLNNRLITENYSHIRQCVEDTAVMRHEWKNQMAALHALMRKGDLAGLDQTLSKLDRQLTELSPVHYSENFTINILLQNAAARAAGEDIGFQATALVPPELGIDERDLYTLLLNLLDNALLAASGCPAGHRNVHIGIRVNQGYLTIQCRNTYVGPLPLDENGQLRTTKQDSSEHGFGLLQIRKTAEKYHGMFDVSYTEDWFTAAASLKLP